MLFIVSPAKSLDFESPAITNKFSQPEFLDQSEALVDQLRDMSPSELGSLMKISDKLASLNVARYGSWERPFNLDNSKQALLSFTGDVYRGLDANSLDEAGLDYAQTHLRILSGLYGLLKPLDLMQPYRLEMGTRLDNPRGKNLYEYWGDQLQQCLVGEMNNHQEPILVNLASKEYFTAARLDSMPNRVVTPIFKDWKNGQYKHINFFAKKARGLMVRYAIDKQATRVEQLKDFDYEGYQYAPDLSSENDWVFTRKEAGK